MKYFVLKFAISGKSGINVTDPMVSGPEVIKLFTCSNQLSMKF